VAVFVGMHTANQSVLAGLTESIDRIAGRTDLQVTAGEAGFEEDVLERIQGVPAVRVAVPIIEAAVESTLQGQGDLLLLGVDMTGDRSLRQYDLDTADEAIIDDPLVFLAQPDSVIVTTELASRNGLSTGRHLRLKTAEGEKVFTIRGIMKPAGLATAFGGNLVIMDVYAAQRALDRGRRFDRIDLAVNDGVRTEEVQREIAAMLGPGFEIQPPAARGRQTESMVVGYSVMVNISSAFALFIGMFIIYNAFATAVTQRRAEIGILRALGATRAQIVRLFLAESALLGLLGSVLGLLVGIAIARGMASAIGGLIGELYGVAKVATDVATDPQVLAAALAIGVITSVVAALVPARGAARTDPVHAVQEGAYRSVSLGESRARIVWAAVCGALALGCLAAAEYRLLFYAGYALTIAVPLLLGPMLSRALVRLLRPALTRFRPVEGTLAADSLIQAPRRTSACVAALMLSVALVIAFAGMGRATYASILEWLDTTLNPDLFVMPSERLDLRTTRFPASMTAELAALPGVAHVQPFRYNRMSVEGRPAMIAAIDVASFANTTRGEPVAGTAADIYRAAATGDALIVSENFAQVRGVTVGEWLDIAAPYGVVHLPIAGIIADYTDQQGTIFMDHQVFTKYWRDDAVSDFHVWVKPGAQVTAVRQQIVDRFSGRRHVFVLTNEEARRYILGVADQWFDLMNVQIAVAVLVAVLGIVNALTVSITDRRRELGVLQAVGALRSQIRHTIWLEAVTIGVLGMIVGAVVGAINLYYLLQIVRHDVIGLRLEYQYPVSTLLAVVPLIVAAAFAAALWPSEAAVRGRLVEALAYE
jgi:putative ABC transport system permease protein